MSKETWVSRAIAAVEGGWVPEWVTRRAIRALCRKRLRKVGSGGCEAVQEEAEQLRESSIEGPVALVPEKANYQHYEVPAELYDLVLGPHRKYSSCYWGPEDRTLEQAEAHSLRLTAEHADLQDGHRVLELGCGWGAFSIWTLTHFPNCTVTAVSNSASQKRYIEARAAAAGVADRLEVITADMNSFGLDRRFDRMVSIEMFEHMRNYRELLRRCRSWLEDDGKLMVHVFCHRHFCYPFEERGAEDWMSRHFFSGGLMPSDDWLLRFQEDLVVTRQWRWSGVHYQKTAEAWLDNMTANRAAILKLLPSIYSGQSPEVWYRRWRLLFLSGAELFGDRDGQEWWVSHYRFEPLGARRRSADDLAWADGSDRQLVGT